MLKLSYSASFKFILTCLLFIVSIKANAIHSELIMQPYSRAICHDYTGTWQGIITDPTDLFYHGGPWLITMSLYEKDGRIIGETTAIDDEVDPKTKMIPVKKVWATCENGVLTNIIWGEKGECGGASDQGMLISKNVLVVKLAYETAMNGTMFRVFLQRLDNKYTKPVPTKKDAFIYGGRKSCH